MRQQPFARLKHLSFGPVALVAAVSAGAAWAAQASACRATSASEPAVVVELYTSEGCNSCPPADRWLSSLSVDGSTQVAAAFHVDYWDHLGWKDRFADPRYSDRQRAQQSRSGARFVYTPQVLVNGRDSRPGAALHRVKGAAPVRIEMQREADDRVAVRVEPGVGAPPELSLWWALLEDGHTNAVVAGENRGASLRHDHVVRRYHELPAWPATAARSFVLDAPLRGEGGRRAQTLVVVTDAADGAPLQALQLGC